MTRLKNATALLLLIGLLAVLPTCNGIFDALSGLGSSGAAVNTAIDAANGRVSLLSSESNPSSAQKRELGFMRKAVDAARTMTSSADDVPVAKEVAAAKRFLKFLRKAGNREILDALESSLQSILIAGNARARTDAREFLNALSQDPGSRESRAAKQIDKRIRQGEKLESKASQASERSARKAEKFRFGALKKYAQAIDIGRKLVETSVDTQ